LFHKAILSLKLGKTTVLEKLKGINQYQKNGRSGGTAIHVSLSERSNELIGVTVTRYNPVRYFLLIGGG
jgi:hypothetical protein